MSYLETGNASEAYRINYNAENMKPESINRMAKELMDNLKIASRIAELRQSHRQRHNITIDNLTNRLTVAEQLAIKTENPSAIVTAVMGIAKLHGLITNKQQVTGKDDGPVKVEMTTNEKMRRMLFLLSKGMENPKQVGGQNDT